MPRADGSIVIDTKLDTSGLKSGLATASKSLKGFAAGAGAVAGAAIAAATAVTALGLAAVRGAEDDEAMTKSLHQGAKSMGLFGDQADAVADRLDKLGTATQFMVGMDENVIKGAQAKLLTFRELAKTADQVGGNFDRATMAALDLSAKGFGDASSTAVMLGKALNDPVKGVTALRKAGVQLDETQTKNIKTLVTQGKYLEAQAIILREVEAQVGGTAKATAKASDIIGLYLGEIGDAFGAALLPLIREIMPGLTTFLTNLSPLVQTFGAALADMIAGIGNADAVAAAGEALGTYLGDGLAAAAPYVASAINGLLIGLAAAYSEMSEGIAAVSVAIIGALGENIGLIIEPMIEGMLKMLQALIDNADQWLTPMVDGALSMITMLVSELVKPENIERIVAAGVTLGVALWDGMEQALGEAWVNWLRSLQGLDPYTTPTPRPKPAPTGSHPILPSTPKTTTPSQFPNIPRANKTSSLGSTYAALSAMDTSGYIASARSTIAATGASFGTFATASAAGSLTVNFNSPVTSFSDVIAATTQLQRSVMA